MDYPNLQRDILEEFAGFYHYSSVFSDFGTPAHLIASTTREDRAEYFRVYNRTARGPRLSAEERRKRLGHNTKLTQEQADLIRAMRLMGSSVKSLALRFKMGERSIYRILKRETYK